MLGYGGANESGLAEVLRPGVCVGAYGDIGGATWRTQGDGGMFRVGRGGRLLARETVLGAPTNLKQARGDAESVHGVVVARHVQET